MTILDRLWLKVHKTDGCWLWTHALRNGYGGIGAGGKCGGMLYAHRLTWSDRYGPIPAGMCVLHRCDVPACVKPEHLFLGTKGDNSRDMAAKGRWRNQNGHKTQCKRGHPFDEANTMHTKLGRACRKCASLHARSRYNPEVWNE